MTEEFRSTQKIKQQTWLVRRWGYIEEVEDWDGSFKYRVTIHDLGRPPFLTRLFRRKESAEEFYDRLVRETAIPQTIEIPVEADDERIR